jgi:hypothetical protein
LATSAIAPNHGSTAPHKSVAGAWQWFGLTAAGSLGWTPNEDASKNREGNGSSALGGCCLVVRHNNQPIAGGSDRMDDGEDVRLGLESQFLVPISGTPIGRGILIPFFDSGDSGFFF